MTDAPRPTQAGLITTETAAALLMVTVEWVRRLTNEGWITKVAKDQYRVQDVVQGYIKYLRDEHRQTSKSAAASRVQDARAEQIALKTAKEKGDLIIQAQTEAVRVIDEYAGQLRADMMAIPAQVTSDLALRRAIEGKIDGAFGAASKRAIAAADRVEATRSAMGKRRGGKSRSVGARKPRVSAKQRAAGAA